MFVPPLLTTHFYFPLELYVYITLTNNYLALFIYHPLSYFSFQPVLHEWCNKGRGMCYPVCGMVHIKEPLLLIDKSNRLAAAGFLSHYQNGP